MIESFNSISNKSALSHQTVCRVEIRNRRLQQEALQHLIQLLPTPNRETLYALLGFLSEVAANSEDWPDGPGNKMDTTNLATVSTVSERCMSEVVGRSCMGEFILYSIYDASV